jgi:hypothetical protein
MLVGVTGYAQHGKDTVASLLVSEYGYVRVAFADALKELAYAMNPSIPGIGRLQSIVDEQGWEGAKTYPEVRRILQVLGTAARDILGDDVWLRAAEKKMLSARAPVVISDVRFPNEAEFLRRHGGELWRVLRLNPDGTDYDNGVGTEHPSEQYVGSLEAQAVFYATCPEELYEAVDARMAQEEALLHGD